MHLAWLERLDVWLPMTLVMFHRFICYQVLCILINFSLWLTHYIFLIYYIFTYYLFLKFSESIQTIQCEMYPSTCPQTLCHFITVSCCVLFHIHLVCLCLDAFNPCFVFWGNFDVIYIDSMIFITVSPILRHNGQDVRYRCWQTYVHYIWTRQYNLHHVIHYTVNQSSDGLIENAN